MYNNSKMEFRKVAGEFLNTTENNCMENMIKFKNYIDTNEEVNKYLRQKIGNVNFDYTYCFYWLKCRQTLKILPPTDDAQYIRAMYDCIADIIDKDKDIMSLSNWFNKISDREKSLRDFLNRGFSPLVNFIYNEAF